MARPIVDSALRLRALFYAALGVALTLLFVWVAVRFVLDGGRWEVLFPLGLALGMAFGTRRWCRRFQELGEPVIAEDDDGEEGA